MKKLLITINLVLLLYLSPNLIFLPKADNLSNLENEFALNKEDLRRIRFHMKSLKKKKHPFKINKNLFNKKTVNFFKIVNNQNHPQWLRAYLFLIKAVPSLQVNEEDC
jgi:hypothetical protein